MHGDICDAAAVDRVLAEEKPDAIVHFAAESHVDRSILSPEPVIQTNLRGTFTLLEAARRQKIARFVHVSTDEVYGSLEAPLEADEEFPLNPSSPYSASKAGSDLLARSYFVTYRLPVVITRASNNYGPYQFPEKLIPLMISNALEDRPLPVYGDGMQVRDWLYVDDHCRGILAVLRERPRRRDLQHRRQPLAAEPGSSATGCWQLTGKPESLIQYVKDRPGHDRRYALSSEKLMRETGWRPLVDFEAGLARTIEWYRANAAWIDARAQRRVPRVLRTELRRSRGGARLAKRSPAGLARTLGWSACAAACTANTSSRTTAVARWSAASPTMELCAWPLKPLRCRFRAAGWRGTPANSSLALARCFPDDEFFLISDQPFPHAGRTRRRICGAVEGRAMPSSAAGGCGESPRDAAPRRGPGPRSRFRGALPAAPAQRPHAARSLAVDGRAVAPCGRQGPAADAGAARTRHRDHDHDSR